MSAYYVNLTGASAKAIREVKASIRHAIRRRGGRITHIYRNPYGSEVIRYRFLRVHFETKDNQ